MPRDEEARPGSGEKGGGESISVEVVYAKPERQLLVAVVLPAGSDVSAAITASGIGEAFPADYLGECETGIWGRIVPRSAQLRDGDRVELYRPLRMDPREARRRRAEPR